MSLTFQLESDETIAYVVYHIKFLPYSKYSSVILLLQSYWIHSCCEHMWSVSCNCTLQFICEKELKEIQNAMSPILNTYT